MSEDNKAEKMDRDDPGYRKWLAERSCSEYMHHTRSGTIQSTRNSEKVRYMFSKKIKLLLCDCEMAVYIVTEDGEVYYWYKVAGSDPIVIYYYSQLIDLRDARFVQTATGRSTFLALTENNTLYYFRIMDNNGLFGWMREIDIRGQITCISCGEAFFVAVTNDYNEVYSWGKNNYGQLGISTCTEEFIEKPCKIKFSGIIVRVACGFTHTLALTAMGEVFVWGGNVYGELGLNHRENVSSPVKIETFGIKKELNVYTKKALDVAAMENLSTVMCEDGLTYVWGICFEQEIRKPVACEYTTLFDACNALCARPPTTVKMSTGKEKSGILEELANAFNDPFMSNLTIEVDGRSIYVDKSVLQIRSSYFRTMSSKLFDEKQSTLKLSQFSYVTYYAYFKYLYTGRIELSLEEKFELLKLADMFKETQLEEFILRTIKKEVTVANVIPVYNMAKKFNKQVLEEYCLKFFAENPKDVIGSDKFVELDEDTKEIFWAKVPEDFV